MKNQHKKIFKGKMMKNELVSVDVIHAEDDYLYGRLDDGRPFMCKPSDVTRLAIIDGTAEDSKGLNKSRLFIFLIIGALALKVFL